MSHSHRTRFWNPQRFSGAVAAITGLAVLAASGEGAPMLALAAALLAAAGALALVARTGGRLEHWLHGLSAFAGLASASALVVVPFTQGAPGVAEFAWLLAVTGVHALLMFALSAQHWTRTVAACAPLFAGVR